SSFALWKKAVASAAVKPNFASGLSSAATGICLVISAIARIGTAAESKIGLGQIAEGFASPTVLVSLDNSSGQLLIADQIGTIKILTKEGTLKPFLDIRDRMAKLNQGFDER